MKIVNRKIKDLIRAEYNPRELTKDQYNQLKDSLLRFGVVDPVIVNKHPDRDNIIIGGHQRSKVWEDMGNDKIPTVELSLTLDKEKELNVRLNKNTGQFDMDMLANHFETDDLIEWGFDEKELVGFDEVDLEAEEDEFDVPDGGIETDIVAGDLFEIGEHRLLCGDSTCSDTVAKLMNGEKADLMVTDPPYNVAYEGKTKEALTIQNDKMNNNDFINFLNGFFDCALIEMKSGAPIYVFCPIEDGSFLNSFLNSGFKLQSILIWVKNTIVLGRKDHQYKHEPILYGWKEGAAHKWYGDYDKSTIIECDKPPRNGEHPTIKPIELLEKCINNSSVKKDLIFDLFLGSGSTMVAAHQLNRKCYGMELDPKYCQVIVDRMMKLDETLVVKLNGKPYEKELVSL